MQGTKTGDQLSHVEGLDQIIVGSGVQPSNTVGNLITGRQDQHRQFPVGLQYALTLAEALEHLKPAEPGASAPKPKEVLKEKLLKGLFK